MYLVTGCLALYSDCELSTLSEREVLLLFDCCSPGLVHERIGRYLQNVKHNESLHSNRDVTNTKQNVEAVTLSSRNTASQSIVIVTSPTRSILHSNGDVNITKHNMSTHSNRDVNSTKHSESVHSNRYVTNKNSSSNRVATSTFYI